MVEDTGGEGDSSKNQQIDLSPELAITISSQDRLQLTATKTSIGLFKELLTTYMEKRALEEVDVAAETFEAAYLITNKVGGSWGSSSSNHQCNRREGSLTVKGLRLCPPPPPPPPAPRGCTLGATPLGAAPSGLHLQGCTLRVQYYISPTAPATMHWIKQSIQISVHTVYLSVCLPSLPPSPPSLPPSPPSLSSPQLGSNYPVLVKPKNGLKVSKHSRA